MARNNQKTISLRRGDYDKLIRIKELYEYDKGCRIDWSDFFLTLALSYYLGRGLNEQTWKTEASVGNR